MSSLCFFLSQPAWDGKIGTVISNAKEKKDFSNISIKFFSSVQLLSHARLSVTPWMQHARLPCPSPTPGACSDSCPLSQWWHPSISSSVIRFSSCLQSFPGLGSFLMSRLFEPGGPSTGASASASVLPMKIQDWFLLELTSLISLQSKGLSKAFSNTTVQKHQFFNAQLSLWSNS